MEHLPAVLIPVYQPEPGLVDLVEALLRDGYPCIVVVNDGSSEVHRGLFERLAAIPRVEVVEHLINLGKGEALKTGLNHAFVRHPDLIGVVTADADGQHHPRDVKRVADALALHPDHLCLGARDFRGPVPWKSRLGNTLSRWILRLLASGNVRDTQSGLRGIPRSFVGALLPLRTARYEFELEMLLRASDGGVPILQIPIETIYRDGNAGSHFNPVWDSLRVYFVFFRFLVSSMLTAVLDLIVFATSYQLGASLLAASALGRLVAGTFNFTVNQRIVFKQRRHPLFEAAKYALLVITLMLISYTLIEALIERFDMNVLIAKPLVEGSLFLVSFAVQRMYVFAAGPEVAADVPDPTSAASGTGGTGGTTDWDAYYERPGTLAQVTRRVTTRRLLDCLARYTGPLREARVLELGGANSCFYESIVRRLEPARYTIVDRSRLGLELFEGRHGRDERVRLCRHDVLALPAWEEKADLCFSVGLIEHFDRDGTRRAIRAHFDVTRPGGLVVLFFPTPTWLYRGTRRFAEILGMWAFPDERPLELAEVLREVEPFGRVLSTGVNWWIVLTQGMVVVEVGTEAGPARAAATGSGTGSDA